MTDYYPLIGKAVAGLEKNTGEARRALYERARTALVTQLRNMDPPLTETEITRERLGLEEAIRKVEAEAARRLRMEPARATPPSSAKQADAGPSGARPREPLSTEKSAASPPTEAARQDTAPQEAPPRTDAAAAPRQDGGPSTRPDRSASPRQDGATSPRQEVARGRQGPESSLRRETASSPPAAATDRPPDGQPRDDGSPDAPPSPPPRSGRHRVFGDRPPLTEEGLRGFRDVVAEAESLGEKTAQATRSARQAYAAVPANIPELDRVEPRLDTELQPAREAGAPRDARPSPAISSVPRRLPEPPPPPGRQLDDLPPPPPLAGLHDDEGFEPARSRKGLVAVLLTLFVILGIGITAYFMRERIAALTGAMRGLAPQAQRDATPSRPKIPDRVGQDSQTAQPRPGQQAPPAQPPQTQATLPAVAQRVVLYEEGPTDAESKRHIGSAIWRTETVSPGTGQAPELAVRCDVEIPERRLAMTLTMRRNTDSALPASHTVEIMFNVPADFPFGGISNVPAIFMKQSEQTRGSPLAGLAVKVTSGFFLVGLSSVEADKERNVGLLKERSWFDIPVIYNNGRRAILAIEKGNPGERAFKDAFAAWGQ